MNTQPISPFPGCQEGIFARLSASTLYVRYFFAELGLSSMASLPLQTTTFYVAAIAKVNVDRRIQPLNRAARVVLRVFAR